MITKELYPLKFSPILKEKIWGGNKLKEQFGKKTVGNIGESWEISGVSGHISKVINGSHKGKELTTLINEYGTRLLGNSVVEKYGNEFPLLFKFIDAKQDLSVQLHPDDAVAQKRHNSFGKTEMWYILSAEEEARLILGFNQSMTQDLYQEYLEQGRITEILHSEKVGPGDAFFIAPGTVHAIGAGVVLAEIQQTSDITYRIYDWDRPGIDGKMRELHNDLALDVINFSDTDTKLIFENNNNESNLICRSPFFVTHSLQLSKPIKKSISHIDSFIVYMCVEGTLTIKTSNSTEQLQKGETILIPSCIDSIEMDASQATLLEVYVP